MDAPSDDQYSRAPQLEDVIRLCRALNDEQVNYVLIGGVAVILYGFTRGTRDIDLLLDISRENIARLKKAMSYLPDKAILEIEDDDVGRYTVVRIADEFVVDLMAKACDVTYDEASRTAEVFSIDGVGIRVAGKEVLIKTKNTIRPGDKMDVDYLKSLLEKENGNGS